MKGNLNIYTFGAAFCYTIYDLDITDHLLKLVRPNDLIKSDLKMKILTANICAKPHVNSTRCYMTISSLIRGTRV